MNTSRRNLLTLGLTGLAMLIPGVVLGQQRRRRHMGQNPQTNQRGGGRGRGATDPAVAADQKLIQSLFSGSRLIRRKVVNLPNGVETRTETDNVLLRKILVMHVKSMKKRVEDGRGFHLRDPLFRELFRNAARIRMELQETPDGVHVRETSDVPYVAKLIQRHAEVVSLFLKNGPIEASRNHTLTT